RFGRRGRWLQANGSARSIVRRCGFRGPERVSVRSSEALLPGSKWLSASCCDSNRQYHDETLGPVVQKFRSGSAYVFNGSMGRLDGPATVRRHSLHITETVILN